MTNSESDQHNLNKILEMFELEPVKQDELIDKNDHIKSRNNLKYEKNNSDAVTIVKASPKNKSIFVLAAILITIVIFIIILNNSVLNSNDSTINAIETETTTTAEVVKQSSIYLSEKDVTSLNNQINYKLAFDFMSNNYSLVETKSIVDVFNFLDYEINKNENGYMRLLIASAVHFQKEKELEVDGMIGPKTLAELAKGVAKRKQDAIVKYFIKNDKEVVKEYGWSVQNVEEFKFFCSYDFDYDHNYNNGYYMHAYEVDLLSISVNSIEGDLLIKYKKLGFID